MAPNKGGPKKHASKAGSKRTNAFKSKGLLKTKIQQRKRGQDLRKKIETRKMLKGGSKKGAPQDQRGGEEESEEEEEAAVDGEMDILLNGGGESDAGSDAESEQDSDEDLAELDLEDDVGAQKMDLEALKTKDPEFYKYLLENDKELLEFDEDAEDDDMSGAAESDQGEGSSQFEITSDMLKSLQKALVKNHSLKALRTLLLAFKAATQGDEVKQGAEPAPYVVHSPAVFNKLVLTTLTYTPVVFRAHIPIKELPSGKFKVQTQNKKYATIQRCVKSYFSSLTNLLASLPNPSPQEITKGQEEDDEKKNLLYLALNESSKLIPFLGSNRRVAKDYLRILLDYWSGSGTDTIRIAAFLAVRKMALAADEGMFELILKNTYQVLVIASKKTNVFTLPSINLMKNSASELFLLRPKTSYQLVFTYVRQLAILLRSSTKSQSKDAYQAVYNWQMIHSVDFWSLVLATACSKEKLAVTQQECPLQPLIYPLVQVSLGMLRLFPTSRFYPLHFHLIRAMLRIMQRTGTFIPLAPHLLSILESSELKRKPKPSTNLKPLDFAYYIRTPTSYLRTRTYADGLVEELCFLLLEYFATLSLNIAFPELVIPPLVTIKKYLKKSSTNGGGNGKLINGLKTLLEKLQANKIWIEERRAKIDFAPQDRSAVANFLAGEDVVKTPLGGQLRRERKVRERQREMLEKAATEKLEDEQ